jgi:hypothetical protein
VVIIGLILVCLLMGSTTQNLTPVLHGQADDTTLNPADHPLSLAHSSLAQGTLTPRVYLPLVIKNYPPPFATLSRYVQTTDYMTLRAMGCNEGQKVPAGQDVMVVLDFGQPWFDGSSYGTLIFGSYTFRSVTQIADGVKGYLSGYYVCAPGDSHLTLAVGTSNYGSGVTYNHGVAWATMINDLNAWISSPPSYAGLVSARGASDIEPGFGSPLVARTWVDGYTYAFTGSSFYYNYGSCDSCPFSGCPTCTPLNGWSVEDIWYVSYGAFSAFPVPEIYLTNGVNADQWYRMSLYGYTNHNFRMNIQGALTQWQACQDVPQANCQALGTDNTPAAGWGQLFDALNADTRTAQPVNWSTDISWQP